MVLLLLVAVWFPSGGAYEKSLLDATDPGITLLQISPG
jgi:hypothetical protein